MQRLLIVTISLFLLFQVCCASKPSDARNIPVNDDSAKQAAVAKQLSVNAHHSSDSDNIPVGSRGNSGSSGNRGNDNSDSDNGNGGAPKGGHGSGVPVSDESAAAAAKAAALHVPHAGDSANIPAGARGNSGSDGGDSRPSVQIAGHESGNNGGCPDRPDDCGICRGWDPTSQCGASRACGKGYTCCESFCCYRQCVVPQDEVQNAHEDD